MALGNTLPFGLRDVKLKSINAAGALGSAVDLPVARTLSFSDTEDFEELRGDDQVVASHGNGVVQEWELEAGGISLEAYAIMAGGSVTTTGVTPNQKKTYSKSITDSRPYFFAEGQAISDNGGDMHGVLYYCKADGDLEGEFADGQFFLTAASGKGYANAAGKVYDFVQNETVTAIV